MLKKRLLSRSREIVTLPDERYRAVTQTKKFLEDILMGKYKRIPKDVKERARSCLRHYPSDWEMQTAAREAPGLFQERMDDLHKMVLKYSQDQPQP
jgi:hypothetical protein